MKAFRYEIQELSQDSVPVHCLVLQGYIDAYTVLEFEGAVEEVTKAGGKYLIFDLSAVNYVSSAGLGAMMAIARKLAQRGGDMVLLRPMPKVQVILEGLGFTKIFKIADTQDEALAKLQLGDSIEAEGSP